VILDFEATVLDPGGLRAGDDATEVAWVGLDEVTERQVVDGLVEFLHEHGIVQVIS
jgi:hypothetical protein